MNTRYTVNQLARLADISRRTLHHYDAIGLLSPAAVGMCQGRDSSPTGADL